MDERDLMDAQRDNQSFLQREQSDAQSQLYAPQLKEQMAEAQAAIIAQTNPSKALKVILEGFRGNMVNKNGDTEKIGYAIMNEKGISRVATMLIPFVNDPIRFGNIDRKEVRGIALQAVDDISLDIGLNWRSYGIKEASSRDLVINSLMALILITLTRSEEQGEKKWLGKVILESVHGQQSLPKKKESSWEKYFKL